MEDSPPVATGRNAVLQHKGLRQFVKFCIVGLSSTVIDKCLLAVLLNLFPLLPWWVCSTLAFCFAVTNGFIWNRRWTFGAHSEDHAPARQQYIKFVLINLVGLMLNLGITKLFLILMTGETWHDANPPGFLVLRASLCAIPFVAFWNFFANKHWTFKASK